MGSGQKILKLLRGEIIGRETSGFQIHEGWEVFNSGGSYSWPGRHPNPIHASNNGLPAHKHAALSGLPRRRTWSGCR